jgi:hypothetical protein
MTVVGRERMEGSSLLLSLSRPDCMLFEHSDIRTVRYLQLAQPKMTIFQHLRTTSSLSSRVLEGRARLAVAVNIIRS